mmetsp:Transcript_37777/g.85062  ORF Transcript_37777/g.85062 Transcript_37777/m.85062 type:complete len:262 (-) Transcript_37777:50-835(-)
MWCRTGSLLIRRSFGPPRLAGSMSIHLRSVASTSEQERSAPATGSQAPTQNKKFDTDEWKTLPNLLTAARLAAVPTLCGAWCFDATGSAAVIFGAAAATDFLDGYLARRWNQRSSLGALLDPLVDKVLVAATLSILVEHAASPLVTIPAVAIVSRELIVSTLREWVVAHRPGKPGGLPVAWHGKIKTALQLLSLQAMLLGIAVGCGGSRIGNGKKVGSGEDLEQATTTAGDAMYNVGLVALWMASALTVLSGAQYVRVALS